jgi:hypothetical protein
MKQQDTQTGGVGNKVGRAAKDGHKIVAGVNVTDESLRREGTGNQPSLVLRRLPCQNLAAANRDLATTPISCFDGDRGQDPITPRAIDCVDPGNWRSSPNGNYVLSVRNFVNHPVPFELSNRLLTCHAVRDWLRCGCCRQKDKQRRDQQHINHGRTCPWARSRCFAYRAALTGLCRF